MKVSDPDFQAVSRLWSQLAAYAAADSNVALAHCLRELSSLLGASNGFWVGAIRETSAAGDPLHGWRPRAIQYLHLDAERERRVAEVLKQLFGGSIDPTTAANTARAGKTRAALRRELIDAETMAAYDSSLKPFNIGDRLYSVFAVDDERESYLCFDRSTEQAPFEERDRELLLLFTSGAASLHRAILGARGLLSATILLTPREQDVLRLLLTEKSEREIAGELQLSESTTHQHVLRLLRAVGAKKRIGLIAKLR